MKVFAAWCMLWFIGVVAAEVRDLNGAHVQGADLRFAADAVELAGQRWPLADLDAISYQPVAEPASELIAVFADGGWLACAAITMQDADQVALTCPDGQRLSCELGEIVAWGPPAWLETALRADGDQLLLGGQPYAASVLALDASGVTADVAGLGEATLPAAEVSGLRVAVPEHKVAGLHLGLETVPGQPPLRLRPSSDGLELAIAPGRHLRQPAGVLRVHGGRRVWLSDLTPQAVAEEGAFGAHWPWRRDANLDGGLISVANQRYRRGVVLHSQAEITWPLAGGYERFHAVVAIDDVVGLEGDCAVTISADGVLLWQQESVRGGAAPVVVDVALSAAQALTVRVDYGARYDIGDHLALADAWLVRAE
ncbi:MAG: NPCBM/NEW2 domain-containing protein [Planctomycetota bacterium]